MIPKLRLDPSHTLQPGLSGLCQSSFTTGGRACLRYRTWRGVVVTRLGRSVGRCVAAGVGQGHYGMQHCVLRVRM